MMGDMGRRVLLALLIAAPVLAFLLAAEVLDLSAGSRRTMETVSASAATARPAGRGGPPLPDLIMLVHVASDSSRMEGSERVDRLEVHVALGDTPLRIGSEHSFGRGGAALVHGARVTSSFDGTQSRSARLDDLADAALGGLASALAGHELEPPIAGGPRSAAVPPDEAPFEGAPPDSSSRRVYDGVRSDGSRESLTLIESPDPYRLALE